MSIQIITATFKGSRHAAGVNECIISTASQYSKLKAHMDVEYVEPTQVRSSLQLSAARARAGRVPPPAARKRQRHDADDEVVYVEPEAAAASATHSTGTRARARTSADRGHPIVLLTDAELIAALESESTDPMRVQEVEYLLGMQNDVYRGTVRRIAMGDEAAARERVACDQPVLISSFALKPLVLEQLRARGWDTDARGRFITPTYARMQELERQRLELQQRQIREMHERYESERRQELNARIEQARLQREEQDRELAQRALEERLHARPLGRVLAESRPDMLQRMAEQRALAEAVRAAALARRSAGRRLND